MTRLPRIAVGSVQPDSDGRLMLWALLDLLSRQGVSAQLFHDRACFPRNDGGQVITGLQPRHLDSWLMSRSLCQELFERGSQRGQLSLVEGQFSPSPENAHGAAHFAQRRGGDLESLCDWLDLPRLAIVDASRLGPCRLPERPAHADGLLLNRLRGSDDFFRVQTILEALWGIPVLAGLPEAPALRDVADRLAPGDEPPQELCSALGDLMASQARIEEILAIADSRAYVGCDSFGFAGTSAPATGHCRNVRVALAFDEAFHCYFPDTLDLLESIGAEVVDFSPLRDESLPADTDLVYFGCGHPERYAGRLASNHCMTLALKNHLHQGRRMYAEGGGLAYLCRYLELPSGKLAPMVGALPAVARRNAMSQAPQPLSATLARDTWLGKRGAPIRGYLNSTWILEPVGRLASLAAEPQRRYDLVEHRGLIGSRIHVNFAAQLELLRHLSLVDQQASGSLTTGH